MNSLIVKSNSNLEGGEQIEKVIKITNTKQYPVLAILTWLRNFLQRLVFGEKKSTCSLALYNMDAISNLINKLDAMSINRNTVMNDEVHQKTD